MINSVATVTQLLGNRVSHSYSNTGVPSQRPVEQTAISEASTVSISEQGMLAAKLDKDPLESYRIPDWMVDFVPKQSILNSSDAIAETRTHMKMLEKLTAHGGLSAAERQVMMDHLANHSPATRQMHANTAFRERFKDELNEYAAILQQAYEQAKQEQGIASRDDYINKVLNVPDDNLALRDSLAG